MSKNTSITIIADDSELSREISRIAKSEATWNPRKHAAWTSAFERLARDNPDERNATFVLEMVSCAAGPSVIRDVNAWVRNFTDGHVGIAFDKKRGAYRVAIKKGFTADKMNLAGMAGTAPWLFKPTPADPTDKTLADLRSALERFTKEQAAVTGQARHAAEQLLSFADRTGLWNK